MNSSKKVSRFSRVKNSFLAYKNGVFSWIKLLFIPSVAKRFFSFPIKILQFLFGIIYLLFFIIVSFFRFDSNSKSEESIDVSKWILLGLVSGSIGSVVGSLLARM